MGTIYHKPDLPGINCVSYYAITPGYPSQRIYGIELSLGLNVVMLAAPLNLQMEQHMAPRPPNYNQERAERDKRGRNKKAEKLKARQDKSLQRKSEQEAISPKKSER